MSAQDRTLDQYQELMNINAVSHLIRAGRRAGIFEQLEEGQRTADQLCAALSLQLEPTQLLLDALVAIGIIENYGEDYALSQAARLLCQYDRDLGDARWEQLVEFVRGTQTPTEADDQGYFDQVAATQWIHTPAAIQAAEVLDIGGPGSATSTSSQGGDTSGLRILDLGCGSGVWSCAMAHRDPAATVTMVDQPGSLQAAMMTAASIGLESRIETLEGDPGEVRLPEQQFGLVILAQRLHPLDRQASDALLAKAVAAAEPGGRVVVIDEFRSPGRPNLAESLSALKLELETRGGRMRSLEETKQQLTRHALENVQFTFLAASRVGLGLAVGVRAVLKS